VKALLPAIRAGKIAALAHVTGGGLLENIPRVLPAGAHAAVDADGWEQPPVMAFLQTEGAIAPAEMARTFNCGVGMVLVVEEDAADQVARELADAGERVVQVGTIEAGERGCTVRGSAGTWQADEAWEARHIA